MKYDYNIELFNYHSKHNKYITLSINFDTFFYVASIYSNKVLSIIEILGCYTNLDFLLVVYHNC